MNYSKSIRIFAILQLCLVFSLLCWHLSYPFMGQLFASKSKKQLIETVMGIENNLDKDVMLRNQQRYNALPLNQKTIIQRYLDEVNLQLKHSFVKKLMRSIHILAFEISPTEQMWIVFAILVPLFFLINFEGARQMAYLLPLIAICYSMDNYWSGHREISKEARLFPTEQKIKQEYLDAPLSSSISLQQAELTLGWHRYLIDQWTHEAPSLEQNERSKQIEIGDYRFQTARVLAQATESPQLEMYTFKRQKPTSTLLFYIFWNICFAWFVNRAPKENREMNHLRN